MPTTVLWYAGVNVHGELEAAAARVHHIPTDFSLKIVHVQATKEVHHHTHNVRRHPDLLPICRCYRCCVNYAATPIGLHVAAHYLSSMYSGGLNGMLNSPVST